MNNQSPHLKQESKITWLSDPRQHPYLRESYKRCAFRSRFPMREWRQTQPYKLIGYSEISVLAGQTSGGFYRRYWWVKVRHDPWNSGSPGEGVKPSSIKPGVPSTPGRDAA